MCAMALVWVMNMVCKDTPVLVDRNAISKSGRVYALAAGLPFMAMPIQEVPLLGWTVANETVNEQNNLIASTDEDLYMGLLDGDPYNSPLQKQRDKYELTDEDWYSVSFDQVDGTSKCQFALTDDWITKKGYENEKIVSLNWPEQGINGPFRITSIKHIIPQKKPEGDAGDGFDWKPITGLFEHQSDQVYNISFENGEELGVTYQHPVYSVTAGDWKLAGQLEVGENVLTKEGEATITSSIKKGGSETVYNLEVQKLHNFLVGESGIVVHNSCTNLIEDYLIRLGRKFAKPGGQRFPNDRPTTHKFHGEHVKKLDNNGVERKLYIDQNEFPFFEEFAQKNSSGQLFKYESDFLKGYPQSLPKPYHSDDFRDANQWLQNNLSQITEPVQFPNGETSSFLRILKNNKWQEYTWHHHQDGKTLILVEQAIHNGAGHTGGGLFINVGLKGVLPGPLEP